MAGRGGVIVPFIIVTLIWSSTWIVIRDQLGVVPAAWSVCYRFAIAAAGMAVVARMSGATLAIGWRNIGFAGVIGLLHFCINFNLLYVAERHLTSGLCALVYALLMVPNSLLAWMLFGERITGRFIAGSLLAIAGIALLFLHEYRTSVSGLPQDVLISLGLCIMGVMCSSIANVMQASPTARAMPTTSMLVWAMLIGALADGIYAWITAGPPMIDSRPGYWIGTLYLALAGSVITFPLYFGLIKRIGAGPAAYTSLAIPILAMAISTMLEGYRWTPLNIAGAVLALIGMMWALRARVGKAGGEA
jgi:drug/metabolite transporter (DMT)-like permease